jgi:hypothetical protein
MYRRHSKCDRRIAWHESPWYAVALATMAGGGYRYLTSRIDGHLLLHERLAWGLERSLLGESTALREIETVAEQDYWSAPS